MTDVRKEDMFCEALFCLLCFYPYLESEWPYITSIDIHISTMRVPSDKDLPLYTSLSGECNNRKKVMKSNPR